MTTPMDEKAFPADEKIKIPMPFIIRRLHSLLGIFLVFYLFEHLLVNSQAALIAQDGGYGFIRMVNKIHAIPYLKVVEIVVLGLPFLVHGLWGMHIAAQGKQNSMGRGNKTPLLSQYRRNRAFTWQRITSWILVVGIILHVVQMRFLEYPHMQIRDGHKIYTVEVSNDARLASIVKNLDGTVVRGGEKVSVEVPSAGAAFLLVVRNTFKSRTMVLLYSLLVASAAYHAFNGLWTALITWGITCTRRSQKRMRILTTILMWVVILFGFMACWGPYWVYVWS